MFVTRSISHTILLVLIQIIVINVVTSEYSTQNATGHTLQSRSGRSKRSLSDEMPQIINVQVQYSTGQKVFLRWYKDEQYLANKHLPVITSFGHLHEDIMDNIGEFVVYQDFVHRCSVVYFKKLDAFFGYIGMNYFITHLPYMYDESSESYPGVVGTPYVIELTNPHSHIFPSMSDVDIETNSDESFNDDSARGIKRPSDSDAGPSNKHQRFDQEDSGGNSAGGRVRSRRGMRVGKYYLETLVFVTRDIAEIFKSVPAFAPHMEWVVRYCIIYFNAIDMSFQSMRAAIPKLRMNIAKIVIEDDDEPFEFMKDNEFQYPESATILRNNIKSREDVYTPDSFDHIFVLTSRPILEDGRRLRAISESETDLYTARRQNRYYSAVPLSILSYKTDYAVAVHEIARTLSIEVDTPSNDGSRCSLQCSGFMQPGSSKCDNCLKWSRKSEIQYLNFLRNNRKRCFLMNAPRSLRPAGPSSYLSPYKQCSCFGYADFGRTVRKTYVGADECDVPLKCRNSDENRAPEDGALRPLDGTPCGGPKVCWNGQCVSYEKNSRDTCTA